jgi:hypothetical protein
MRPRQRLRSGVWVLKASVMGECRMPDDRFDILTKLVSKSTSRRGLLKGAAAAALGGVAMRLRGSGDAAARARVSMACARLGQPCATGTGTPGNMICCPHLICGDDAVCCKGANETCLDDGDCCADNVCRPNPTGLGNRCLPPGDVGAECVEDFDCLEGLVCEVQTSTCAALCGEFICPPDYVCDPYTLTCTAICLPEGSDCESIEDCCLGLVCAPNTQLGGPTETYCVECLPITSGCFDDRQCCSGACNGGECELFG